MIWFGLRVIDPTSSQYLVCLPFASTHAAIRLGVHAYSVFNHDLKCKIAMLDWWPLTDLLSSLISKFFAPQTLLEARHVQLCLNQENWMANRSAESLFSLSTTLPNFYFPKLQYRRKKWLTVCAVWQGALSCWNEKFPLGNTRLVNGRSFCSRISI